MSREDIEALKKFEPNYIMWRDQKIFTGFGNEGVSLIASLHLKITGGNANVNCHACLVRATELVFNHYYNQIKEHANN